MKRIAKKTASLLVLLVGMATTIATSPAPVATLSASAPETFVEDGSYSGTIELSASAMDHIRDHPDDFVSFYLSPTPDAVPTLDDCPDEGGCSVELAFTLMRGTVFPSATLELSTEDFFPADATMTLTFEVPDAPICAASVESLPGLEEPPLGFSPIVGTTPVRAAIVAVRPGAVDLERDDDGTPVVFDVGGLSLEDLEPGMRVELVESSYAQLQTLDGAVRIRVLDTTTGLGQGDGVLQSMIADRADRSLSIGAMCEVQDGVGCLPTRSYALDISVEETLAPGEVSLDGQVWFGGILQAGNCMRVPAPRFRVAILSRGL